MKLLLTILLLTFSSVTLALGETERDILTGAVGVVILQEVFRDKETDNTKLPRWKKEPYYSRHPDDEDFFCRGDVIECEYKRGEHRRRKEEIEQAKRRAYECGYNGNC